MNGGAPVLNGAKKIDEGGKGISQETSRIFLAKTVSDRILEGMDRLTSSL